MSQLPPPLNGGEQYLAAVYERLGEILARMPERPTEAQKQAPDAGPETVELREPAPEPAPAGEALAEPAPPTRPTTRKRTTRKGS